MFNYKQAGWSLAVLVIAILTPKAGATCPSNTIVLDPIHHPDTQAIQYQLDTHPTSGTTLCFSAGTYYLTGPLFPYTGQLLTGDPDGGAILDGSKEIVASFGDDGFGNHKAQVGSDILPGIPVIPVNGVPCQVATDTLCRYTDSIVITNPNPAINVCPGETSDGATLDRFTTDEYYEYCMPSRAGITAPTGRLSPGKYVIVYSNGGGGFIYLADDPTGKTVYIAKAPSIIERCTPDSRCADNVTIQGLIIQKVANQGEVGAIDAPGSDQWIISGNIVRYTSAVGILVDRSTVGGSVGHDVRGSYNAPDLSLTHLHMTNYLHHNGQIGLAGSCVPAGNSNPNPKAQPTFTTCLPYGWDMNTVQNPSMQILHNRIDHNNTHGFSAQFGAGAAKFAAAYHLLIDHNEAYNNNGPAFWCDINCKDVHFTNNTAINNHQDKSAPNKGDGLAAGIIFEVSRTATITGNDLEYNDITVTVNGNSNNNNGFLSSAQILVAESSNVTIGGLNNGNTIIGMNGIGFRMSSTTTVNGVGSGRTDWCGGYGATEWYTEGSGDQSRTEPYCASNNSYSTPQSIHDIRDGDGHNHSTVTYNDIREEEPSLYYYGEIAGYDTDMGDPGLQYYFKYNSVTDVVFDHNTYHPGPTGTYFTPHCGHQGLESCGPLLNFSDWKTASGQDTNSIWTP
jgi:hypothetical protein